MLKTTQIRQETDKGRNKYDYKSLEEFIKEELKGETEVAEKVNKLRKKHLKDRQKAQHQAEMNAIEEIMNLEDSLNEKGLVMTNSQKKKFLIDFEKERQKEESKSILEYWKKFSNEATTQRKEDQKLLDSQMKAYEKIAKLRAAASLSEEEKSERKLANEKEIQKLQTAINQNNKDDVETNKERQEKIKQLQEENKTLSKSSKQLEREADKESVKETSKEDFLSVFEDAFKEATTESDRGPGKTLGEDLLKSMKAIGKTITEGLNQINTSISSYANYQTAINARMQGARGDTVEIFGALEDNLGKVAYSPLIRAEDLYSNLSDLVAEGIAANVEQRAFLQTVKDGIATTFDANNGALKRIIRLQQYDSTAARLGMEAYLTSYLNELTQNTEYLQSTFDSVAESLIEASSLMSAKTSTEFEYVIQKWLGTLEGLGLDETTATNISTAIGYLGSGNVSELASSNMQNLLVMATVKSGLSYSDLLTGGLTADTANQIMYNIVNYMAELGSDSNNNVVKSQLASTFGVNVSDLVAAKNIVQNDAQNSTITNLYNNLLTYNDMYTELERQMGQLSEREGFANILENLFYNFSYSTGMNIASNPALYATWKVTDMIQSVTGGINIPYITALGNGVDLETTVENLMKIAIVGASTLSGIGDIVSGLQSVGDGSSLLNSIGIGASAKTNVIARGSGYNARASGKGTSISTMIGNANSQDYVSSTITAAEDAQQEKIDAAHSEETSIDKLNDYMQGEGKEISEGTLESIKALNDKIDRGITVRLEETSIAKFV